MQFSKMLLTVRVKMKYSQSQLAKDLGVSIVTINRWENNVTKPSKVAVLRLEDYCNQNNIKCEVCDD